MNDDSRKAVESVEYLKSYCLNTQCDECVFKAYSSCWFTPPPCFWKSTNSLKPSENADSEKP